MQFSRIFEDTSREYLVWCSKLLGLKLHLGVFEAKYFKITVELQNS